MKKFDIDLSDLSGEKTTQVRDKEEDKLPPSDIFLEVNGKRKLIEDCTPVEFQAWAKSVFPFYEPPEEVCLTATARITTFAMIVKANKVALFSTKEEELRSH